MDKYKAIKNIFKRKLSNNQKALLRLFCNIIKNPKNMQGNLNSFREQKELLRKSEISFVPPIFIATVSDNCNLRCPTCLYLLKNSDKFSQSFISTDKFSKILAKYNKKNIAKVIFFTGGEPLLHPEIDKLIDISRKYNADINISTNGILIKDKILCLEKVDYINVSLDSYDYKSFEKYRGGTQREFDMIIKGLKALKERNLNFSISYVLSKENLSEINDMLEFADSIKPKFAYFHNINPHGCEQYKPVIVQDENTKKFLGKIVKRFDYPFDIVVSTIFDTTASSFLETQCIAPWDTFCFNTLGDISFCCHLVHDPKIGNILANYNFNSPEIIKFREAIMAKKITTKSCLYCQRRFLGQDFCSFDSKNKKWFIRHEL